MTVELCQNCGGWGTIHGCDRCDDLGWVKT